jgi:cullin 1
LDKVSLTVYEEYFEAPFITATEKYYKSESNSFLTVHSIPEYLMRVEDRLKEEEDRVDRYLNTHTRKAVSASFTRGVFYADFYVVAHSDV